MQILLHPAYFCRCQNKRIFLLTQLCQRPGTQFSTAASRNIPAACRSFTALRPAGSGLLQHTSHLLIKLPGLLKRLFSFGHQGVMLQLISGQGARQFGYQSRSLLYVAGDNLLVLFRLRFPVTE
ncbi:hypothetical protein D3C74_388520 [compost metagenome]